MKFYDGGPAPSPRATPTLDRDRVYTLGATGLVNALDAVKATKPKSRKA